MIPNNNDDLKVDFQIEQIPTSTFNLDISKGIISGKADELDAMVQTVYLILNTERFLHPIYSWNYGVEFSDLVGQDSTFAISEIKRRITEALLQDDRITSVSNFEFEKKRNKVNVTFTVTTIFGDIEAERAVNV